MSSKYMVHMIWFQRILQKKIWIHACFHLLQVCEYKLFHKISTRWRQYTSCKDHGWLIEPQETVRAPTDDQSAVHYISSPCHRLLQTLRKHTDSWPEWTPVCTHISWTYRATNYKNFPRLTVCGQGLNTALFFPRSYKVDPNYLHKSDDFVITVLSNNWRGQQQLLLLSLCLL